MKAIAQIFGYECDCDEDNTIVRLTFQIHKEELTKLSPMKFGDVFGIENLTNKEGKE